jgi:hypothetical protein
MTYLPPYRHELRGAVKPFVDALTARRDRLAHQRFRNVLDEVESLIIEQDVPRGAPEDTYSAVVTACRDKPANVTDKQLAEAIAAATIATKTDILGILYQHTGRTAEEHFDQYFTPPNVAAAAATIGETARAHFEPPTPTVDTVSGGTTLSMFGTDNDGATDNTASDGDTERESTVFFDPACGSGRLLLAAARRSSEPPIALGWDIERDAARMAALTLALVEVPGWVVGGDATQLATRELYRIAPSADTPLRCFRSFSPTDVPEIISSRPSDARSYSPRSALQTPTADAEAVIREISRTLEAGIDQTVGNPPFSACDLDETHPAGNKAYSEYGVGQDPIGDTDSLRSSQKYEWLFTELALEFTKPEGNVALIVPTSMLGNPSESDEREWLLDIAHYEAGAELPPEAFAPETTTGTSIVSFVPKTADSIDLQVDHQIFMAIAETVGHDKQATRKDLLKDGEPVELPTDELPAYFTTHRWRGIENIRAPDDDLIPLVSNHRDMRADDETETLPLGKHVPSLSQPTGANTATTPDGNQPSTNESSVEG